MSWDEAFANRYDEWSAPMTADVGFYVDLARAADGPLVELAASLVSRSPPTAASTCSWPAGWIDPAGGQGHGDAMAVQMSQQLMSILDELRYQPTQKRLRGLIGGEVAVDSADALVVWEPRRVVPSYAVPVTDVVAELSPAAAPDVSGRPVRIAPDVPPVYDPSTPFGVHTTEGEPLTLRSAGGEREGAAFRPADPDLARYVVLDFDAFDTWLEEDEEVVSHPRDPFHRIDVRRSSRHVRIERDGQLLAESTRPRLVFETSLPVRTYLPPEDVRLDLLQPSPKTTACAYKGVATYRSFGSVPDIAWTYERPLPDAVQLTGLVCFFDERVDVTVDGERRERPLTPWS